MNKLFQNHTSQLKVKIVQDVIKSKMISAGRAGWHLLIWKKDWVITKNLNTYLYSYKIAEKQQQIIQMFVLYIISLTLDFLPEI